MIRSRCFRRACGTGCPRITSRPAVEQPPEPASPAPDAPVAAAAPAVDPMERLKDLGELHEQGILTDEEFASEKEKVLNG